MNITNITKIHDNEWMFEYYGRMYIYYTDPKEPMTEVYSCNEAGVWVAPYLCLTRQEFMPLSGTEEEIIKQIYKFMMSGDNEQASNIGGNHYCTMYDICNYAEEYHSGDLQKRIFQSKNSKNK